MVLKGGLKGQDLRLLVHNRRATQQYWVRLGWAIGFRETAKAFTTRYGLFTLY